MHSTTHKTNAPLLKLVADRHHLRALVGLDSIPRRRVALRPDDYIARRTPKSATHPHRASKQTARTIRTHGEAVHVPRCSADDATDDNVPSAGRSAAASVRTRREGFRRGSHRDGLQRTHGVSTSSSSRLAASATHLDGEPVLHQSFAEGRGHCGRGTCFNLLHRAEGGASCHNSHGGYGLFRSPRPLQTPARTPRRRPRLQ